MAELCNPSSREDSGGVSADIKTPPWERRGMRKPSLSQPDQNMKFLSHILRQRGYGGTGPNPDRPRRGGV
ncbi:hypothetical protein Ntsu_12420 [Nocardia sp. IFM 10818]